ncbi:MAG: flagellar protein FliT [Pseudomonadota bacterium]|nr:flagellar protein FliT [Pseudomonadota bacterium]
MTSETIKLVLLTHSKNMLNAAESGDWKRFSELDSDWQKQLQAAVELHGSALDSIGTQLIEDNHNIQRCIKKAQDRLSQELQKNNQSLSSVKQYLK